MNTFLLWAESDYEAEGCYCYEVTAIHTYHFFDRYDWHEGMAAGGGLPGVSGFKDEWAAALHDAGLAREFEISGWWYEGKIYTFQFYWLFFPFPQPPASVEE